MDYESLRNMIWQLYKDNKISYCEAQHIVETIDLMQAEIRRNKDEPLRLSVTVQGKGLDEQ